jgi:hypothetical protein
MTPELLKRIAVEKRALALPLLVALVANILAYAFVVYPLGVKSAGAADRAAEAASARRVAAHDEMLARALVTGKARADDELAAFYQKVLPADLAAATRMTFASVPALARRTNITYVESRLTPNEKGENDKAGEKNSQLGRLAIRVVLKGDYQDIRSFIYQLETSPEFVIIDSITLLEGTANEPQTVTFDLSTYYRLRENGA